MSSLRGVAVGCGYFSRFHLDAWARIPAVCLQAVCDQDESRATAAAQQFSLARSYSDLHAMLDIERPDFLDIITPPATHLDIVTAAAQRGIAVICQKPLAPTIDEARQIVEVANRAGIRLMVHENFRFQPWHREIRRLLDSGAIGTRLHTLTFRTRTGDGRGADAYLARQPYFRTMPRLLVVETGIHFIDTFRYLAGEIDRVYALLRKLNPVIAGEDCGLLVFEFAGGAVGVWDANRYNDTNAANPRLTFGEFLVEADGGSIRLYPDGRLTVQEPGRSERDVNYAHEDRGFAGDCVYATQQHFVQRLLDGGPFETDGVDYLKNLAVQEAVYESARLRVPVAILK